MFTLQSGEPKPKYDRWALENKPRWKYLSAARIPTVDEVASLGELWPTFSQSDEQFVLNGKAIYRGFEDRVLEPSVVGVTKGPRRNWSSSVDWSRIPCHARGDAFCLGCGAGCSVCDVCGIQNVMPNGVCGYCEKVG